MSSEVGFMGDIIVSGDDVLAATIATELNRAGATVVKLPSEELTGADLTLASAIVCAGRDDAKNLENALLARKTNPNVRVVARLGNDVLRGAVAADNGPGAILDVADLAAPSVVEACLASNTHPVEAAGIDFVVSGAEAPRDATLREIYGDLAPVAVIHGQDAATQGEVVPCPGRDHPVRAGDWTAMIGSADELAARGIKTPRPTATRSRRSWVRRASDAARAMRDDVNPCSSPPCCSRSPCCSRRRSSCTSPTRSRGCPGLTQCISPRRPSPPWDTANSPSPNNPRGYASSPSA